LVSDASVHPPPQGGEAETSPQPDGSDELYPVAVTLRTVFGFELALVFEKNT
jgi:hypothetical protein